MIHLVTLLLTGLSVPNTATFDAWRQSPDTWIRVGLQDPMERPLLSSDEPLLVLDGEIPVTRIDPKGEFWIFRNTKPGGVVWWVQVQAGSLSLLHATQKNLQANNKSLQMKIVPIKDKLSALRIGPYPSVSQAKHVRKSMIDEGFSDAYLIKKPDVHSQYPLVWVNKDFEKFVLPAQEPGLARIDPNQPIQFGEVKYRGMLNFKATGNKWQIINKLPLETYLRGVVPAEMGPIVFPELEALKAQAIAARTYAIKNLGRFEKRGYDICDSPACQAYGGFQKEHALSDQAIAETQGLVLFHGNTLIDALYTSTCGGMTDDVAMVFPGRNEPYLKSKTSYLSNFSHWQLPEKALPARIDGNESLLALSVIYGLPPIPQRNGDLTPERLMVLLQSLEWILGKPPAFPGLPEKGILSHTGFWRWIARYPFVADFSAHQVNDLDLDLLDSYPQVPEDLRRLAALCLRFDLATRKTLTSFSRHEPITEDEARNFLILLIQAVGPAPEWKKYRVESMEQNVLQLSRYKDDRPLNLQNIHHYLTMTSGSFEFREAPRIRELDYVYLLEPPFDSPVLRVEENGLVGSVDRFSSYNSWTTKKTAEELETRARRYVNGLRGIRDIRILDRSKTGRVTLMEFIADSGRHKVDGLRIRWSLGIRENLFDILPSYRNGKLIHATFVGRGWGHGIGMSQVGAYGLARMGWDVQRILSHYYTGVEIRRYQLADTL